MNRNFDFNAIKEYQSQMVEMINQQISTMNTEKKELELKKNKLQLLIIALRESHSSHDKEERETCSCEEEIGAAKGELDTINTRLEELNANIGKLETAITETNNFITSLRERIERTDYTFAEKIRDLNEDILEYIAKIEAIGGLIGRGKKTVRQWKNRSDSAKKPLTINVTFADVLANITKGSFEHFVGKSLTNNISNRFVGHPNKELGNQTIAALGILNISDPMKLIAWTETLGLQTKDNVIEGVGNGFYEHLGIPVDYLATYLLEPSGIVNDSMVNGIYVNQHVHAVNLRSNMQKIYALPAQNPTGTYIPSGNNWHSDEYYKIYKRVHKGSDFSTGGTAYAANGGVVTIPLPNDGSYGNGISILDKEGNNQWYAHLDSIDGHITTGRIVLPGEKLGIIGDTGKADGIHLHFEVMKNAGAYFKGKDVDPALYLPLGLLQPVPADESPEEEEEE